MSDQAGKPPIMPSARTILITGASSGIGRALALRYADKGVNLALIARDQSRLQETADACGQRGAVVRSGLLDVRDRAATTQWLGALDRESPVDLVIANAGLMAGTPPGGEIERADTGYAVLETNVMGVLNTVQPLLPAMMARRRGQIAIIGSLAGMIALPDSPSYCASKSAVLSYGLALRALLAPSGISVSVVCPGYITTPMSRRESGRKPFEMPLDKAVERIVAGLARNRAVIAFPFILTLGTRLHSLLPDRLRRRLLMRSRFTVGG